MRYPRVHPAPMETCGRRFDGQGSRQAHGLLDPQARTLTARYALVAGLPEHKIQIISPTSAAVRQQGRIYRGSARLVGSIVTGAPVNGSRIAARTDGDRVSPATTTCGARSRHHDGKNRPGSVGGAVKAP